MENERSPMWVKGTLVDNAPIHIDQGNIIARFATIQTATGGQTLRVLDEGVTLVCAPISGGLTVGHTYIFLLVLGVSEIHRLIPSGPPEFKIVPPTTPGPATWYGQLVTLDGKSPIRPYTVAVPRLDELEWAIVRTPVGLMVVNPDKFDPTIMHPGDAIRWKTTGVDLLGAWEPE